MFPYFATFTIAFLFVWIAETQYVVRRSTLLSLIFLGASVTALSLLAAFRAHTIGTDLLTYVDRYFYAARESHSLTYYLGIFPEEHVEPLYKAFTYAVSRFTDNVRVLYFLIEFIDCSLVMAFLWENRKKASPSLGLLVYMLMMYNITLNAVRQMMAICVCLVSYNAARDRRFIKFSFEILAATLIHRSAMLMIITYPLVPLLDSKKKLKRKARVFVLSAMAIVSLIFINTIVKLLISIGVFPIKFSHYVGNDYGFNSISAVAFSLPVILVFWFFDSQYFKNDRLNAVMLLYVILWPAFAQLDGVSDQFGRVALFFLTGNIYIFAQLPVIEKHVLIRRNVAICMIMTLLFLVFYWVINYAIWNVGETVPYLMGNWR